MTILKRNFLAKVHNPELARVTIKQSGGWKMFSEKANDISSYGAENGFRGWTTYVETSKFFDDNKEAIKAMLSEDAEELGLATIEMVKTLKGVDLFSLDEIAETIYSDGFDESHSIKNAISWYIVETYAHIYQNMISN